MLIAVALVAIAVVVRNRMDSGNNGNAGGKLRLVCTRELESLCDQFRPDVNVDIQDPGSTEATLEKATGDPGLDAWLTPGPWPQIVEGARSIAGSQPLLAPGAPLGATRIGLAVWPDRLEVLIKSCPNQALSWRCFGDAVGKGSWTALGGSPEWGPISIGFPDPPTDATGLAALGAATAGYFGRDPTTLSSTDLGDPGFQSWLRKLVQANADNPKLEDVLVRGPAEAAAVATLEALGQPLISSSARTPKPSLTYPAPVASADVVLGSVISDRGRQLAQLVDGRLPELLRKAGWGVAVPIDKTGLPPAGLLDALRDAWKAAE